MRRKEVTGMPDREKVIRNLQSVANVCALNGDIQSMRTIDDALALLKEQEVSVKPQFDDALDRNDYIKIGDLIDCMTELSMPKDAAFY